ncbi:MAG: Cgl0159 family (beta/alpha)8-fold protein [Acidimicrobiales bacterium]
MSEELDDHAFKRLLDLRARSPEAVASAAATRSRRRLLNEKGTLFLLAADHAARGQLGVGANPMAMGNRRDLLGRLLVGLRRPGVDGVLGTADVIEDLLLLGALDDRIVIGSMNRGGLHNSVFELDDRFTGYTVAGIVTARLDGGKMLCRMEDGNHDTVETLEACGRAISELAANELVAMVEPFPVQRSNGTVRMVLDPDMLTRAIAVASGLGTTSAYTWLKVPVVHEMARVMAVSTLPAVILGGDASLRDSSFDDEWRAALSVANVRGIVAGRSLLYPPDGDVERAVDRAVALLAAAALQEDSSVG